MFSETETTSTPTILIIDDAPAIHALIRARLRDERVKIHSAGNGREGLEMATRLVPDVILLDVDMPDISGIEVIRGLKANKATFDIAVIFLTGDNSSEAKVRGFDLGAVDYVTKPFDAAELRARVRSSLRTKSLLDLLATRARLDGLTGLWNKSYFSERLAAEASLSGRTGNALSLAMVDVDHFKSVNDTYGHPFGDEVLKAVARVMQKRARISDVVCRYGGEEFALILPNTSAANAAVLAEEMRVLAGQLQLKKGKGPGGVTVSIGVAELAADYNTEVMVAEADEALYEAKRGGRNRVVVRAAELPVVQKRYDTPSVVPGLGHGEEPRDELGITAA